MIYLDNASTTKIYDSVNKKIFEINEENYFNPSAPYQNATDTFDMIFSAKEELAKNMGTTVEHIIFTSGATESNNLAIFGFLTGKKDAEYIFSSGEHPSVYNVSSSLKTQNKVVKYAKLSIDGTISIDELTKLLTPETHFVSIIHVSNETGAINDIKALCKAVKDYNPNIVFHSDGTQAFGKIEVDVEDLGVDCYTISAHKFHGPKGVGALYVKNIDKIKPIQLGGGQQDGKRSGTENTSGFVGMALASTIATKNIKANFSQINAYREYLKQEISSNFDDVKFNESSNNSPYILSVSIKGIRGEVLLHMLEKRGILIGIGSACSSKKQSNRVLESMKVAKEFVLGSIRISFSSFNSPEDIKVATNEIINQIRILKGNMSK
ncbi:MAG: cysteine desulfurase [Clostridia bacterium]|nr:cysteine desulfurase [Clostridia bacterium]